VQILFAVENGLTAEKNLLSFAIHCRGCHFQGWVLFTCEAVWVPCRIAGASASPHLLMDLRLQKPKPLRSAKDAEKTGSWTRWGARKESLRVSGRGCPRTAVRWSPSVRIRCTRKKGARATAEPVDGNRRLLFVRRVPRTGAPKLNRITAGAQRTLGRCR
jgi:hypothetical protein